MPLETHQSRWLEPCVLGNEVPPRPELTKIIQAARSNKAVRRLAKSAAAQLRHLTDIAAFEDFVCRAALASVEQDVSPIEWLQAQVDAIKREQEATRSEHSRMTARAAGEIQ